MRSRGSRPCERGDRRRITDHAASPARLAQGSSEVVLCVLVHAAQEVESNERTVVLFSGLLRIEGHENRRNKKEKAAKAD